MDDKIKDIFGSLDEQDLSVALVRKEHIWSKVQPEQKEKKKNHWWLLLLLGGLLFTAGWFLNPGQVNESLPIRQHKTPELPSPDASLQFALHNANSLLNSQQESLDSLQVLNVSLSDRLLAMSQKISSIIVNKPDERQRKIEQVIRDTIYLTEVKVEQRIVEKIIRDTIILEVPSTEGMQSIADVNGNIPEEVMDEEPKAKISNMMPSSVQFNFSETNHIDK